MKNYLSFYNFTKRQKFVLSVAFLALGLFLSEFFIISLRGVAAGVLLALLTSLILFLILRKDMEGEFAYPILILPFLYTLSFSLFYLLVPSRFLTKVLLTALYTFGLYSLFLTQNIFAVSSIRTISLLRSARIVSFIVMIVVFFFLVDVIVSVRLPFYLIPALIFLVVFMLNIQSFWSYSASKGINKEIILYSLFNSLVIYELSLILLTWPVDVTIYSIFLTGIFYAYSGLSHTWFEGRLFKGVLWEYVWVGFLSMIILFSFSKWGF